jgi:hypothetical protein
MFAINFMKIDEFKAKEAVSWEKVVFIFIFSRLYQDYYLNWLG